MTLFRRKRTKKNARNIAALVAGTTAANIIAPSFPGTSGAALQQAGTTGASFVGPTVTVFGSSIVLDHLENLRPRRKSVRRKRK